MLKLILRGVTIEEISSTLVQQNGGSYIAMHQGKTLAELQPGMNEVVFQISQHLSLEEFQVLHDGIVSISEATGAEIDETKCQLGYLQNGDKAYLISNWDDWKQFLVSAKLKTLEGQNVIVKKENGEQLGAGLLAEFTTAVNPFRITSCTLITLFGDKKIEGTQLTVEPAGQFG
ncbi:hypothetical protein [Bacillus sp. T33-2]|uniref:hypothetical protein n=1 Tax=Bacillus sp. T33-2 TaxID=2054168 RepID=UPI00115983EF|nr:hypothetical protein [Bacillus sp. T33-2]